MDSCITSRNIATGTFVKTKFNEISATNLPKENIIDPKTLYFTVAFYLCSIRVSPKTPKLTTRISFRHESQSKSSSDFVAKGGCESRTATFFDNTTSWVSCFWPNTTSLGALKKLVSNRNLHFQVHMFRCYVGFWGVYAWKGRVFQAIFEKLG